MNTNRIATRQLVYTALMTALIAVCAWITIPIGEIPITLQTFGVFCAVGLLGGQYGTVSIVVYLLLGAFGAPVFSGFSGGIAKLVGPTGGYLIGFIGAALIYWAVTKIFGKRPVAQISGMILGNLVCYAFGTAWFMVVASSRPGLATALSLCVIPYIIPDLVKIVAAFFLTRALKDVVKMD